MPIPVGIGVYTKKNKTWGTNFKETPSVERKMDLFNIFKVHFLQVYVNLNIENDLFLIPSF